MTAQSSGPTLPQGFGQVTNNKRKQANVVDMLEYVKGLNIDPVKDSDMLWIAEEAYNAALPPGWSEHTDEKGRVYFHNGATGESVWRHPMDDLFREIVEYQRNVVRNGGFHQTEDEIAELEENIRRDLADWMELFDDHGELFFYNRRTDESRFDDPRMAVYHNLYARIKMVAKMKERMPVLARAPRPEEPTAQELDLRRRQKEEEDRYLRCLIKVQSCVRVVLAKRIYRNKLMQATVQKGPQPLRGKLRLRMEKLGDGSKRELVLAMTTPHRKNRSAMKIQAIMRGVLTRKRFKPLVQHRLFLSRTVTPIQSRARVWLAKRRARDRRQQLVHDSATNIQRVFRGYAGRQYVKTLSAQRARALHFIEMVKFIQKRTHIMLERKRLKEKFRRKFVMSTEVVQRQLRMNAARKELVRIRMTEEPLQAVFKLNHDPASRGVIPYTLELWMSPCLGDPGKNPDDECDGCYANAFHRNTTSDYQQVAATKVASLARGKKSRNRVNRLKSIANDFIEDLTGNFWKSEDLRINSAIRIQSLRRGYLIRRSNPLTKLKMAFLSKCSEQVTYIQAFFMKYVEQQKLLNGISADAQTSAATLLQTVWRGWLARRQFEKLRQESLWTMKGWFEYTATGRDACQVEVKFVPNPSFDDYGHFLQYGPPAMLALDYSIEDLEDQLKDSIAHIESILGGPLRRPSYQSVGGDSSKHSDSNVLEESLNDTPNHLEQSNKRGSKISAASSDGNRHQTPSEEMRKSSKLPQVSELAEDVPPDATPLPKKVASPKKTTSPKKGSAAKKQESITKQDALSSSEKLSSCMDQEVVPQGSRSQTASAAGSTVAAATAKPRTPSDVQSRVLEEATQDEPTHEPPKKIKPFEPLVSQTQQFFNEASKSWQDKPPLPHPDDPVPKAGNMGENCEKTDAPDLAATAPKDAALRKSYGGAIVNGKFVKNKAETVDELTEDEQNQVLADLEDKKVKQQALLSEKAKLHKARKQKEEQAKMERLKSQMGEAERFDDDRRKKKVKELKNWLKNKEDEARRRRDRDADVLRLLMEKEQEKSELLKRVEQERLEQRERRLRIAEKQKAKLEKQLLLSRDAAKSAAQLIQNSSQPLPDAEMHPVKQRVVHRHVHHHLHYHDENEGDGQGHPGLLHHTGPMTHQAYADAADEQQLQIEMLGEAKLHDQGSYAIAARGPLPHIDPGAVTPTRRRALSHGMLPLAYGDQQMARTQQAFQQTQLPALPMYQKGLEQAMGTYADSGRPPRRGAR